MRRRRKSLARFLIAYVQRNFPSSTASSTNSRSMGSGGGDGSDGSGGSEREERQTRGSSTDISLLEDLLNDIGDMQLKETMRKMSTASTASGGMTPTRRETEAAKKTRGGEEEDSRGRAGGGGSRDSSGVERGEERAFVRARIDFGLSPEREERDPGEDVLMNDE